MSRILAAAVLLSLACLAVAPAAGGSDGAVIINSGSMRSPGYTIKVRSDGTAEFLHIRGGGEALDATRKGSVPPALAQAFLSELKDAKHSGNVTARACAKIPESAYSIVVRYHGWTTPDLTCGGDGFVNSLGAQANKIAAALGVTPARTHNVPMLPNEKRRSPSQQPQASASPEPAPSAS